MNSTLLKAAVALVLTSLLVTYSVAGVFRRVSVASMIQLAGATCLLIVVLTHVAEGLHLFPAMHWGEPRSPGHYLDLASAIAGVAMLLVAVIARAIPTVRRP